jgi:hypothetical protein
MTTDSTRTFSVAVQSAVSNETAQSPLEPGMCNAHIYGPHTCSIHPQAAVATLPDLLLHHRLRCLNLNTESSTRAYLKENALLLLSP